MAGRKTTDLTVLQGGKGGFEPKPEAQGTAKKTEELKIPPIVRTDKDARAAWKVVTEWLAKRDMLDGADTYSLAIMCRQWARYVALMKFIDEHGETYEVSGRHGVQQKTRPEAVQLNDLERRMRSSFTEHGLTPMARVRLRAPKQTDLFEELSKALS